MQPRFITIAALAAIVALVALFGIFLWLSNTTVAHAHNLVAPSSLAASPTPSPTAATNPQSTGVIDLREIIDGIIYTVIATAIIYFVGRAFAAWHRNRKHSTSKKSRQLLQLYLESIRRESEETENYSQPVRRVGGAASLHTTPLPTTSRIPLDRVFIPLRIIPIQSVWDVPVGREQLQEEHYQRPDLSHEERAFHLKTMSPSRLVSEEPLFFDEVLQRLTAEKPVAVILGAPGSGKSTIMNWFAQEMARASLSQRHPLSRKLSPRQIPILLRINDYTKRLQEHNDLSFEQFFREQHKKYHDLLIDKMEQGGCLVLIDGLDEADRDISAQLYQFISNYFTSSTAQGYNRFIITSRIFGYQEKVRAFLSYPHYALLNLDREQIEQFLAKRSLITEQQDRLLETFEINPGVKRLAANPQLLTLLIALQAYAGKLPQSRIGLYEAIVYMLLDEWNMNKPESFKLKPDEIEWAKQILSELAYQLQGGSSAREKEVSKIAGRVIAGEHNDMQMEVVSGDNIQQLLEKLRRSCELFIRMQKGYVVFAHRSFQEYFIALYLAQKPLEELKQAVVEHYRNPIWHEPILLVIASKSRTGQHKQASELIKAILTDAEHDTDSILHRNLLFAAESLADCDQSSIEEDLQKDIASRLFNLYGDSLEYGRFIQLQRDIEEVALLLLRVQTQEGILRDTQPPFLNVWRSALCDDGQMGQQLGAVHLLAAIAPDLPSCSPAVRLALIPPLLKLAKLHDLPGSSRAIRTELRRLQETIPISSRVEEYAFVALHLLNEYGPAGWLHSEWSNWGNRQPELLKRLTNHALELEYLITPAAFPGSDSTHRANWERHIPIVSENRWRELGQRDAVGLQQRLLQASNAAHYPSAYLLKEALDREIESLTEDWKDAWDKFLREEMMRGLSATYQPCLGLRLLLSNKKPEKRKEIANELIEGLSHDGPSQIQALIAVSNLYLRDLREVLRLRNLQDLRGLRDSRRLYALRYLRDLRALGDLLDLRDLRSLFNVQDMVHAFDLLQILDLHDLRAQLDQDRNVIVEALCKLLKHTEGILRSEALLCLYSIAAAASPLTFFRRDQIQRGIQSLESQSHSLTIEHRLLRSAIQKLLETALSSGLPSSSLTYEADTRGIDLYALRLEKRLGQQQVEDLLVACTDTRQLSEDARLKVHAYAFTVQRVAWKVVTQPFVLELKANALDHVVHTLENENAIVCAAAAWLLRRSKNDIPSSTREAAVQSLVRTLKNEKLSHRLLDVPNAMKIERLDDVLFDTLRALAE